MSQTITVNATLLKYLRSKKRKGESYSNTIMRLIDRKVIRTDLEFDLLSE